MVSAHIGEWRKIRNIRSDPRVALSIETDQSHLAGLGDYLVMTGTARISEGGAPQLLRRLAAAYIGPATELPWTREPPAGRVTHITAERIVRPDSPNWYKPAPLGPASAEEHAVHRKFATAITPPARSSRGKDSRRDEHDDSRITVPDQPKKPGTGTTEGIGVRPGPHPDGRPSHRRSARRP